MVISSLLVEDGVRNAFDRLAAKRHERLQKTSTVDGAV